MRENCGPGIAQLQSCQRQFRRYVLKCICIWSQGQSLRNDFVNLSEISEMCQTTSHTCSSESETVFHAQIWPNELFVFQFLSAFHTNASDRRGKTNHVNHKWRSALLRKQWVVLAQCEWSPSVLTSQLSSAWPLCSFSLLSTVSSVSPHCGQDPCSASLSICSYQKVRFFFISSRIELRKL